MLYIVAIYWGLVAKYLHCVNINPYSPTTVLAVFMAAIPQMVYLLAGFASFYLAELFYWAFSMGVALTEIILLIARVLFPSLESEIPPCQLAESDRPSHEAAIMTFTTVYYIVYHWKRKVHPSLRDWVCIFLNIGALLSTCAALLYLETFTFGEVVTGAAFGATSSAITVYLLYAGYLAHTDSPFFKQLLKDAHVTVGATLSELASQPSGGDTHTGVPVELNKPQASGCAAEPESPRRQARREAIAWMRGRNRADD